VDEDASALTASGAVPDEGDRTSRACGGASVTVTVRVAVDVNPPLSFTVTVTEYVPTPVYV
jgi:hypothetical protein